MNDVRTFAQLTESRKRFKNDNGGGTDPAAVPQSSVEQAYLPFRLLGILIVRTIAVFLFFGDCAAFTDINRPVIALSPILRVLNLITSCPELSASRAW